MLFSNATSIDLRREKKKALIKGVLCLLGFAVVAGISFVFFYLCKRFNIFSLLSIIPMSVPSIIVTILLVISFVASLSKVTDDLYFKEDNKVLLTLPTNGNTLFLSRLMVCYLNAYKRSLFLEIPFLVGYFIASSYPVYMYFVVFIIWALVDLASLLLASLFSVPLYYVKKALKTHTLANALVKTALTALVLALCILLITLIPNKIDIFSNWGFYFAKIQNWLNFYKNNLGFFYKASMLYLGNYTGFSFSFMSRSAIDGLYFLIGVIALIVVCFISSLALASPLYLKLASGTGELQSKVRKKKETKERRSSPFMAQLKKEALLFFKDPSLSSGYIGTFVALPLIMSLIAKIFSAMDLNSRGQAYVQTVLLLITLLIALSSNSMIARIYSREGGAFYLARTYPLKEESSIGSKLVIPASIGSLSILASTIALANIRSAVMENAIFCGIGIIFIFIGHLLYSAGLDFTNPRSSFGDASFLSKSENRSVIMSFITSAIFAVLSYYFFKDNILWLSSIQATAGLKIFLLGIIYLAINVLLYIRKIKYIYKTGETL